MQLLENFLALKNMTDFGSLATRLLSVANQTRNSNYNNPQGMTTTTNSYVPMTSTATNKNNTSYSLLGSPSYSDQMTTTTNPNNTNTSSNENAIFH